MKHSSLRAVFGSEAFADHEQVVFCRDAETGLRAIIAVHDTTLGPAIGGVRMWPYDSEAAALRDVLRLSQAMTRKCALAGVPFGGGKAVILGDPETCKTPALLQALGRHIARLGGSYVAGEDVGIGVDDIREIHKVTPHVRGLPELGVGDPSPYTARGVLHGIRAALADRLERHGLAGVRVCIQGLGHVGFSLARQLQAHGARLYVSDWRAERVRQAKQQLGAEAIAPEAAHKAPADVFAPCALGGILNSQTIPRIKACIVAGAANNQLAQDSDAKLLAERGILYAPDYVINAGGVIALALEGKEGDASDLERRLEAIGITLGGIFARARQSGRLPGVLADEMARQRLARARRARARKISQAESVPA